MAEIVACIARRCQRWFAGDFQPGAEFTRSAMRCNPPDILLKFGGKSVRPELLA
jgi:hypothetical protein